MVYGMSYCPTSKLKELKALGFADSKTLDADQRSLLFEVIQKSEWIGWSINCISPQDISSQ
jgi:ribonuclease H2 subunit A